MTGAWLDGAAETGFGIDALLGPDHQFRSVEEAIRARAAKS